MGKTIMYVLIAAASAAGSITAVSTPAQADDPPARIKCTDTGNGELCLHVWHNRRAAVSYKKIRGSEIYASLGWWTPGLDEREVLPRTTMVKGRTYSGFADARPNSCFIGHMRYLRRLDDPTYKTVQTPSSCGD